jgi:hypothetical protein
MYDDARAVLIEHDDMHLEVETCLCYGIPVRLHGNCWYNPGPSLYDNKSNTKNEAIGTTCNSTSTNQDVLRIEVHNQITEDRGSMMTLQQRCMSIRHKDEPISITLDIAHVRSGQQRFN